MFGNIGPLEIGIVLIIALIVFGPKRLPELGSGLGRGMREFKDSISGDKKAEEQPEDEVKALSAPAPAASPAEHSTGAANRA